MAHTVEFTHVERWVIVSPCFSVGDAADVARRGWAESGSDLATRAEAIRTLGCRPPRAA